MLDATVEKDDKTKLKMEWRKCPKCGLGFKTLETSPQIYHSTYCEQQDGGKAKRPIKDKKKPWESLELDRQKHGADVHRVTPMAAEVFKNQKEQASEKIRAQLPTFEPASPEPPPTREPLILVRQDGVRMQRAAWEDTVNKAKGLIQLINQARMDIAGLALSVCIIRQGGKQGDKYKTGRSLKDFAKQIGICHKTLCEWVRVKRMVVDKLPEGLFMPDKYGAAQRAAAKVTPTSTPEQVVSAFTKEANSTDPSFYFNGLVRKARTQANYLENNSLKRISRKSIEEMQDYCKRSLKVLKSHLES